MRIHFQHTRGIHSELLETSANHNRIDLRLNATPRSSRPFSAVSLVAVQHKHVNNRPETSCWQIRVFTFPTVEAS